MTAPSKRSPKLKSSAIGDVVILLRLKNFFSLHLSFDENPFETFEMEI